ncbi:hypothetical protein GGR52DRAFT_568270 [Hypoxylon sp. FL1284]|nr:hypothetical protein GGR52DRAFT_568270 [Hypoxylon sp. FL1284]
MVFAILKARRRSEARAEGDLDGEMWSTIWFQAEQMLVMAAILVLIQALIKRRFGNGLQDENAPVELQDLSPPPLLLSPVEVQHEPPVVMQDGLLQPPLWSRR